MVDYCYFYFALRQCDIHVAVCHEVINPLIPQQADVIPMPTGSHDQGLVLRYIERAASAANHGICIYIVQQGRRNDTCDLLRVELESESVD